jgi:hypothetical protein
LHFLSEVKVEELKCPPDIDAGPTCLSLLTRLLLGALARLAGLLLARVLLLLAWIARAALTGLLLAWVLLLLAWGLSARLVRIVLS